MLLMEHHTQVTLDGHEQHVTHQYVQGPVLQYYI